MTSQQAHQQAAQASRDGKSRFVVYVPDEGDAVYDNAQMLVYSAFVQVEAVYLWGARMTAPGRWHERRQP